jgi:glutathione peroxidase
MKCHLIAAALIATVGASVVGANTASACPALLNHNVTRLQDEAKRSLCEHAGKVVVVVNTASYCGFTSQYTALEALYSQRGKDGLVVLGFPSNDFGEQEPGTAKQIAEFCSNTFGVKFPMYSKGAVSGKDPQPVYAALAKASGKAPKWNFHKYVIGRDGKTVASFDSAVAPDSSAFLAEINKQLAAPKR